jgi:ubiquitin
VEAAPLYQKKKSHRAAAGLTWSDGKTEGLADQQLEAVQFFFKVGHAHCLLVVHQHTTAAM